MKAVELAEKFVLSLDGKEPEQAELFGLSPDGFVPIAKGADVYDLLGITVTMKYQGLGLLTCGWAAPLDENGEPDGMPSEHPGRKRVILFSCYKQSSEHPEVLEKGSALWIQGQEDVVTDEGDGIGSLDMALEDAVLAMLGVV